MNTTLKGLIMSFTKSVDLYNYLLKNHHRRTAIVAYSIGKEMDLTKKELSDLVIAAALHDIGALTVKERDDLIQMDVINPMPHARIGSYMLESFELFSKISRIIYYHHWSYEKDREWVREVGEVPIQSYIIHVADRIEILIDANRPILLQKNKITETIHSYKDTLFHPKVVEAFDCASAHDKFWLDIDNLEMSALLEEAISDSYAVELTLEMLEEFAFTISKIIDTRSEFTISHSFGVSEVAYKMAELLEFDEVRKRKIRVAGLLHDIGKIAIPPSIIEKKGSLDADERIEVQTHAYYSFLILQNMEGLGEIVKWACNHHENHDGSGYPMNLSEGLTEEMDIIAYADIFTALSENRPYRASLSTDKILEILGSDFIEKHGEHVYEVIREHVEEIDRACKDAIRDGENRYQLFEEFTEKQLESV